MFENLRTFVRNYTDGVDAGEIPRVVGRDAGRAFNVLTRDQPDRQASSKIGVFWDRTKRLFMGLSYKLAPPRRILFAVAILVVIIGLKSQEISFGSYSVYLESSPFLLLVAIGILILLLILELADRVVVRDELEVARQLQAELIAEKSPTVEGWSFAFSYRTANTIGGDYYEFVPLENGKLLIAAGDASGHGIAAGLVMAVASATLKLAADRDPDPVAMAETVNGALFRTGGPRAFMTFFLGVLEPKTGGLEYVCCGHPFPMLRHEDGRIDELGRGGLPLGIRRRLELEAHQTVIKPGEVLAIFSDGVPEALNAQGDAFGFDRLQTTVEKGGHAQEVHNRIRSSVFMFCGDEKPQDDLSLVVVESMRSSGGDEPLPPLPPT